MSAQELYSPAVEKLMREFAQKPAAERPAQLPGEVKQAVLVTAKTGISYYPWLDCLQPVLSFAIDKCARGVNSQFPDCPDAPGVTFEEQLAQILDNMEGFEEAPFTIQRICELLVNPEQYRSVRKYLGALDKLVTVTTTLPHCKPGEERYFADLLEQGDIVDPVIDNDENVPPPPVDPSTVPKDALDVMAGVNNNSDVSAPNKPETQPDAAPGAAPDAMDTSS